MWDRFRGSSSGTSIPVATSQQFSGRHPTDVIHKTRLQQLRHFRSEIFYPRGDKELGHDIDIHGLSNAHDALGILNSTEPSRYEIRRGKLVPRSEGTDL